MTRKVLLITVAVFLIRLASTAGALGQGGTQQEQPQKSDTLRLKATEVFVDAIVFDRKSRLVADLTAQDFEVYEDGVKQDITSFQVIRGGAGEPPQSQSPRPATGEAAPDVHGERPNLTILLLDYSTTQFEHQKLVREACIKYVEQKMQPNDFIAVFVLGAGLRFLSNFTNDKPKLISALKTYDATGSGLAADRATLDARIAAGQSEQTLAAGQASVEVPSGPGAAGVAAALARTLSARGESIIAQHVASLDVALRSAIDQRQGRNVLAAIRAIAMGMRGIEGRKTLLLFSEGFVVGPGVEDELHSIIGLANRSQLAVYCIESRGLETRELKGDLVPRDELYSAVANPEENKRPRGGETGFDRARQVGPDLRESALRFIADSTGGFLIRNTNDLGTGLARVDQERRSYYLLSYQSRNEKMDGRFRQIRVNVLKPGLSVRGRSGYYAMPTGYELLTPAEFQVVEQARAADASTKIPLFLRAAGFQQGGGRYRIPVILEIPTASIRFDKIQASYQARLSIIGIVRDRAGNFLSRFGGAVQVSVTEAEYNTLKPGTVSFVNYLDLPAGSYYSFDVTVKDALSGAVSSGQQALYLREPEKSLSLSAILLSREVDKSASAIGQFLTMQGVKILPSARSQFRNGDNFIFYFEIYNPKPDGEGKKTDITVELSLSRDGQAVNARLPRYRVNDYTPEPVPHITFARYLQLAGLAPGKYMLVVEVKDALGNQTARGQARFSIVD